MVSYIQQAQKIVHSQAKACIDYALSILFFVCIAIWLFPLIAFIILLITAENPIFKQQRIGLNYKLFVCYKFKTVYKRNNALTRRLVFVLKKINLDELVQIINVLKGEMSLVGPRPHAVHFQKRYEDYGIDLKPRQMVKPGITGLAQVKGFRGDADNEQDNKALIAKRISLDEQYVNTWHIGLDCKLIIITCLQLVGGFKHIHKI